MRHRLLRWMRHVLPRRQWLHFSPGAAALKTGLATMMQAWSRHVAVVLCLRDGATSALLSWALTRRPHLFSNNGRDRLLNSKTSSSNNNSSSHRNNSSSSSSRTSSSKASKAKCRDHRSKTSSRARVPRRRAAINSRAAISKAISSREDIRRTSKDTTRGSPGNQVTRVPRRRVQPGARHLGRRPRLWQVSCLRLASPSSEPAYTSTARSLLHRRAPEVTVAKKWRTAM